MLKREDVNVQQDRFSVTGDIGLVSEWPTAAVRVDTPRAEAISSIMPLCEISTTPLCRKSSTMPR